MRSYQKQDDEEQFQQIKDEVLTYAFSENIQSVPLTKQRKRNITKNHERHRLELIVDANKYEPFDVKQANKHIKKIESSLGKIIPIGNVVFRSNFQCGNLADVKLIGPSTYHIQLEKQTNSNRISSWFYFNVQGLKGQNHFVIKGFTKSSSLYNQGMKLCYRQIKQHSKWRRGGTRIVYTNSEQQTQENVSTYELRFSHFFKYNEYTCVQFAYCFPYGLKKLYHLLSNIKNNAECSVLGKSYQKKDIPLLTIGNANSQNVIILSARVHPGQTVSSFIIQGFIKELVGDNQFGKHLRENFLFKIVPMINIDGVFLGNYRFSAFGCDLNRKWKNCKENSQPEIYHLRELIRNLHKQKKIIAYIDIHGHSRKKNVFFYGCCEKGQVVNTKPKEFPYLMEKILDAYKYENCCFAIQKDKQGTARVTMWNELKIDYVYTLQSTFCGSQFGSNYMEEDYERIGKKLCEGIAIYFYDTVSSASSSKEMSPLMSKYIERFVSLRNKVCTEFKQNPKLVQVGEVDNSGSDSEPQFGQISQKQRNPQNGLPLQYKALKNKRNQNKNKKIMISTKLLPFRSNQNLKDILSQQYVNDGQQSKLIFTAEQLETNTKSQNIPVLQYQPELKKQIQIKIASSVNTYQMQSLKASALFKKNMRVHSITRHTDRKAQRQKNDKSFRQINITERSGQKMKIHLIQGKEGAQYRRVYKLAQQSMKKNNSIERNPTVITQLHSNQLNMKQTVHVNRSVAPRFYPNSQSKCRRVSTDMKSKYPLKSSQFKKLSINGDQFSVRCFGRHVYI